jgi:exodeoxyribonuclease V alpha subunit
MRVIGVISKINRKKTSTILEITDSNLMTYTVSISQSMFLPIDLGDKIHTYISKNDGSISTINEHPLVILSVEEEYIIDFFRRIVRGSAKSLYEDIETYARLSFRESDYPVIDLMNNLAIDYQRLGTECSIPEVSITDEKFYKVISKWYSGRLLRQLYLLGLRRNEINRAIDIGINEIELYRICLDNPYRIPILSFETCDGILKSQQRTPNETQYYCGQILREIWKLAEDGWSYCPLNIIERSFPKIHQYKKDLEEYYIIFDDQLIDKEEIRVYHSLIYQSEVGVAQKIKDILTRQTEQIEVNFENDSMIFVEEQKNAIVGSLNNPLSIIIGAAGSGKSTILRKIVEILDSKDKRCLLTSFTGKAVARICEIIGKRRAETMDYYISRRKSLSKKSDIKEFDYLIIDEISMVSTGKFYSFLQTFSGNYNIILIGDDNQLPPIGYGSLFRELLRTKKIPVYKLQTVHRVDDGSSNILLNSQILLNEKDNNMITYLKKGKGYYEIFGCIEKVQSIISTLYEEGVGCHEFKILCPYREPLASLSSFVQELYRERNLSKGNPESHKFPSIEVKKKKWCIGDRVVMLENNYPYYLRNGQEGNVVQISDESINVVFEDTIGNKREPISFFFEVEKDEINKLHIDKIELSFAMTVHKAQGSEYSYVIVYIPKKKITSSKGAFLNVNLIYTAITRAKTICWVGGDKSTFYSSIKKRVPHRFEKLAARIGIEIECGSQDEIDYEIDYEDMDTASYLGY